MLRNFRASESGNVAIMFAFALLPLLGGVGLAVDYARMSTYQAQMQSAVDAAALSLAYSGKDLNADQLKAAAEKRVSENFEDSDAVLDTSVTVERGNDFVSVSGNANIRMTLMNLLGHSSSNVNAFGKAVWGSTKLEVVLVLDNSGSMGDQGRLVELKKASKELIDILEEAAFEPGSVKIGVVPFATAVRVNPATHKNANWIAFNDVSYEEQVCSGKGKNKTCWNETRTRAFNKEAWGGCLIDRSKTSDRDTHDNGYTAGQNATLSPAVESCPNRSGENEKNLGYIAPLSENFAQLKTSIDAMVDGGYTNMTIGLALGSALLTKQQPFTEASDAGGSGNHKTEKIIIALSDGANTYSAAHGGSGLDARNEKACTHAKTIAKVYTILLISGNEALLKKCASSQDMYKKVNDAASLIETFRAIGKEITKLRLAV